MKLIDQFDGPKEWHDLLRRAEDNSADDWETDFVGGIVVQYEEDGENMDLSESDRAQLEKIANYFYTGDASAKH